MIILIAAALCGSFLSFFCGFGLGTLLLPAFILTLPVPVAIAASALVHMANNLFKLFLLGRYAEKRLLLSFGLWSVVGALMGAITLIYLGGAGISYSYVVFGYTAEITLLNSLVGCVIIGFSWFELSAAADRGFKIERNALKAGGWLSGFFGGLSGHQGALRSAFLMRVGLSKEAFMGTRVVCACMVDLTRISVYAGDISTSWNDIPWGHALAAVLSAFTGAWLGNRFLKKMELPILNRIVSIALILFGLKLMLGL
jgi:uncharacterized membrane protein YfcA